MRGFVTALVVALILVTGGSLVLIGIIQVREAASRISCRNNLRVVGMAVADYQQCEGCFPMAAMPNPDLAAVARLSWLVSITPYVEADNLYARMDKEKGWEAEENRFAALSPQYFYDCPGSSEGRTGSTPFPTCYVGITGIGEDAAHLPLTDARAGFFGYERKLTPADIPGPSSSLLVAIETSRVEGCWTAAGKATLRGLGPGRAAYLGAGGPFGGLHHGGANALFADGSVRFLPRATAPKVLEALATLRGGKDVGPAGEE